jgi:tripartite-type tricarboxylate transporter receptor subunit TctC
VRDFTPVSLATIMPFLLAVHPSLPAKSVRELVALSKARPDQLNYGSPGNGSTTHLANELLKSMTGMRITHIPYKGVAPAATDLISGQIQMMSGDLSTLLPHQRSGRLRGIAVTGAKRSTLLPRHPDHRGIGRAGIRGERLVRLAGPRGHVAGHRGAPQRRDGQGTRGGRRAGAAGCVRAATSRQARRSSSSITYGRRRRSGAR